jgi:hypothetical protein
MLSKFIANYNNDAGAWANHRLNVNGQVDSRGTHIQPMVGGEDAEVGTHRVDVIRSSQTTTLEVVLSGGSGSISSIAGDTTYDGVWTRRLGALIAPVSVPQL